MVPGHNRATRSKDRQTVEMSSRTYVYVQNTTAAKLSVKSVRLCENRPIFSKQNRLQQLSQRAVFTDTSEPRFLSEVTLLVDLHP